jgi:hypothetical protein
MKYFYYYYYFEGMPYTENIFSKETPKKIVSDNNLNEILKELDDTSYYEFEHLSLMTMCNQFFRVDMKKQKMSDLMMDIKYYKNLSFLKSVMEILVYYPYDDEDFKEEVYCLFPYTNTPEQLIEDFNAFRIIFYKKIAEDIQDKGLNWDDNVRLYHELLLNSRNKVYENIF